MARAIDAAGGGRARKSSPAGLIIEILAVTALAAGVGAAAALLQGAPSAAPVAPASAGKASSGPGKSLIELPPIVTNIASPADLWIRVEASIVIDGKSTQTSDVLAAEIATDALAYLRTLTIAQIEGPIGLQNIRQDLTERAIMRSKGEVSELILKTLVVQ